MGIITLGVVVYSIYASTRHEFTLAQENITKLSANSTEALFAQLETVLNILENQLLQDKNYASQEKSWHIFNELLKSNKLFVGFDISPPDKTKLFTKNQDALDSFQSALSSETMVIGRTYFLDAIGELVIPIRKSIIDEHGRVVAVITAGISLKNGFSFLNQKEQNSLIFRDKDYYNQLIDASLSNNHYAKPIPKRYVQTVFKKIQQEHGVAETKLKDSQKVYTIKHQEFGSGDDALLSITYIKKYKLWIVTKLPCSEIASIVLLKALMIISLFIVVNIIIFLLFRFIASLENKKQELLYFQAIHDDLTGLFNRNHLHNHCELLKSNRPFTLFSINIDNFKNINDNYGHNYGNMVLIEISKRLLEISREQDVVVRYNGDEFLIFMPHSENLIEPSLIACKLVSKLSQLYTIEPYQFLLSASIGVASFPQDAKSVEECIKFANIAMGEAKKRQNSYYVFDSFIKNVFLEISNIENELQTAIENGEIYMVYQPQLTSKKSVYGVEALVRWESAKLGFIPPDKFIRIAENIGFIQKLGSYIMQTSLNEIKKLQDELGVKFQLSINISVKQFMENRCYEDLMSMIENSGFDKSLITLEITEGIFIENTIYITNLLNKFKKEKIRISLDDFGTGYSSLGLLKKLPIDELKIDKSFIDDIAYDASSLNMVAGIISMASNFNMEMLAEGVEYDEQKTILQQNGCHLFQGYLYSKPLKLNDLRTFLQTHIECKDVS